MDSTLTRRQMIAAAAVLAPVIALGTPHLALAQSDAEAPDVPEMTMGDPNAPLTVVEYAMFSCPHCADFHRDTFPQVKSEYIDTGKVHWVFREVYFNKAGLWAAMIARCAPEERYFGIADLIMSTQSNWMMSPNGSVRDDASMVQELFRIGRQAGMTDDQMNTCMQDRAFAEALVATYQKNAAADRIDSTPTFIMNGAKMGSGAMPWAEFKAKIDEALGA